MQKKLTVSFDSAWILSRKDDAVLPVQAFVSEIKKLYDVEILSHSLTECELVFKSEGLNDKELCFKAYSLLWEMFSVAPEDEVVNLSVSELADETAAEQAQPTAPAIKMQAVDSSASALSKINSLIGAEEFKQLANECARVAPGLIKHNTVDALTHRCYIFSINEGYGLTTYLELFSELLHSLGILASNKNGAVIEEKLPPPNSKEPESAFSSVLSKLSGFGRSGGQVVSIDISEWMTSVSDRQFRDFLARLEDRMGDNIIIFRVPFVEKDILAGLKKGIGDMLFVRDVSFVPFDKEELTRCAGELLSKRGYTVEDAAWEIFSARITEEKNDGRFYGINTVNKVVLEMIYRKQLDNALNDVDDSVIKVSEIAGLAAARGEGEATGTQALDEFIGMETIKQRVEEIVAQIEMSIKNKSLGHPCIHMRFVGSPGTGKTTVARVIGKILKEKGILRNGDFFEYSGRDFCGRYVGETAPKTAAMCRDAYGSVLFIDEAYSLYPIDGHTADYGREAIDTLIAEMENHRQDLVVIMAGYPDEMENLMRSNAGLESRMPYIIEFPNYTREQLYRIFMLMVNKNFKYGDGFAEAAEEYFLSLPDDVVLSKEFSNARFVRNLFERTWGKAVLRAQLEKSDEIQLIKEDFVLSSSEKEFKKIMQKQKRTLGFI